MLFPVRPQTRSDLVPGRRQEETPAIRVGIVQVGPQDTANKLRTAPLWGLRTKPRFMHDLQSLSLEDAIFRHDGEASEPAKRFKQLTPEEKQALITFLNTL